MLEIVCVLNTALVSKNWAVYVGENVSRMEQNHIRCKAI